MEKSRKKMSMPGRFFLLILFFHTLLYAGVNSMTQAIVQKGELRLSFSKNLDQTRCQKEVAVHLPFSIPMAD